MIWAKDQLVDETSYPHLAKLLRSGGTLEIGENFSLHAFARLRKGNRIVTADRAYPGLAAILKYMDSLAKEHFEQAPQFGTTGSPTPQ
jgi:hypothetical protein